MSARSLASSSPSPSVHAASRGQGDDIILPFRLEDADVRGRLVRLGPALDAILSAHDDPEDVATLLGEALTLAAVMAGSFKFDGSYTLQTSSDGPISLMIADFSTNGDMRGYAVYDAEALAAAEASGGAVPRLLGAGLLAFTVDQGPDMETYQGVVRLEGATLADCAHDYLRQSEQLKAAVRLDVGRTKNGWRAGAIMLEQLAGLPEEGRSVEQAEDSWRRAVALLGSAKVSETLGLELAGGSLLFRLFNADGVRVFESAPLQAKCRCSRDRIVTVLASFQPDELHDMVVDGRISSICQFCKTEYTFTPAELAALSAGRAQKSDAGTASGDDGA
jgi:molecular chaperone Hsp33